MALLDLNKIVLQRTVIGITCPGCGGLLEAVLVKAGWQQKQRVKKLKPTGHYRCQDCRRHYQMSEMS